MILDRLNLFDCILNRRQPLGLGTNQDFFKIGSLAPVSVINNIAVMISVVEHRVTWAISGLTIDERAVDELARGVTHTTPADVSENTLSKSAIHKLIVLSVA